MSSATSIKKKQTSKMPLPPAISPLPVRRFTVDEYHSMVKTGVLVSGEPYELIHGWIIQKMGIDPPHNYAVNALMELFVALRGPGATVRIQQPITTIDSEPEPDVVIAVGTKADYAERHPAPEEVHVLVEVAESTLKKDRSIKLELYAEAKIQEYWIVNIIDRRVEVYTQPHTGKKSTYKRKTFFGPKDDVPLMIAGKEMGRIPVKELLR